MAQQAMEIGRLAEELAAEPDPGEALRERLAPHLGSLLEAQAALVPAVVDRLAALGPALAAPVSLEPALRGLVDPRVLWVVYEPGSPRPKVGAVVLDEPTANDVTRRFLLGEPPADSTRRLTQMAAAILSG